MRWSLNSRNTKIKENSTEWYIEYTSTIKKTTNTYAISRFYNNGDWVITDIFKWNIPDNNFYASNLLYDQFVYAWRNINDVKTIRLDKVINKDTIDKLQLNGSDFNNTALWKMINHLNIQLWKTVKSIELWDYKYLNDLEKPQYWYEFINIIY